MTGLIIKVILATCAFALAILQVSGKQSLELNKEKSFFQRLTRAGMVRILLAFATLLLLSTNEFLNYRSSQSAAIAASHAQEDISDRLQTTNDDLIAANERLEDAQFGLALLINEVANLRQNNQFLQRALDGALVVSDSFSIPLHRLPADRLHRVVRIAETEGRVEKGDIVEWTLDCPLGSPPDPSLLTGSCALDGYGAFQAYSDRLILSQLAGRKPLNGTRSNDGEFLFHTACPRVHEVLVRSSCDVDVTVMTQARTRFFEIEAEERGVQQLNLTPEARRACRTYEALYGESCEHAVERMR